MQRGHVGGVSTSSVLSHCVKGTPQYLVLPGDGNTARVESGVEVVIDVVQGDSPHCRKLLQVSYVIAVHQPGLFHHHS